MAGVVLGWVALFLPAEWLRRSAGPAILKLWNGKHRRKGWDRVKKWRQWLASGNSACALWVALCFALTSAAYLSWLDRLVALTDAQTADWLSLVAGYLLQAAGMLLAVGWLRKRPDANHRQAAALTIALFAELAAPSILTGSLAAMVGFGLLMNLVCGLLGGLYLYALSVAAAADRRGLAFGCGYAAATVAVGLLALVGRGALVRGNGAMAVCVLLAAAAAWAVWKLPLFGPAAPEALRFPQDMAEPGGKDLCLTCAVIVLISAVKNLGFSFPSADIRAGLVPQLSRLPYAVGLVFAGAVIDRSRKNGMICTLAALALPFIMLGLTDEPLPSAVFWGLDYLFFGFFSVFRATVFLDIAARGRRWELAPLGLLLGRLGDAAGTAAALLLTGRQIALIAVTALAFTLSVVLLLRQFQRLYEPTVVRQKNEHEVFESFCLRSDLSNREREVLRMVLAGHSNASIAEALFITENTVKYHVRNVLQKTGCKNRSELQKQYALALYPNLGGNLQGPARDEGA